ncbi:rhomboid family intramembrane serine protease [Microbaculum marinum]|uniref:Rhomboid family intramembrane serine protease n=1 Tax=Microbaculum marinum TaxID=1764581 RepID=A0AAW9S1W5_9HYPH
MQNRREPIFNIPAAIVAVAVLLTAIHIVRMLLPEMADVWAIFAFGFVPARYAAGAQLFGQLPGGGGADVWTFVSYAFLHGDWVHLGVNVAWMVAFGTPVLRRFGAARFVALSLAAAVGGAALHLITHWGAVAPMIGASAAISGQMGAATRFAFQRNVMFGVAGRDDDRRWRRPAMSLVAAFRDVRVLAFVGVWFAVNYVFGATDIVPGVSAAIAWQAHVGGFLVGLLLFPLFDIPKSRQIVDDPGIDWRTARYSARWQQVPGDQGPGDQGPGDQVPEDQVRPDQVQSDQVQSDQVPGEERGPDRPGGDGPDQKSGSS